MDNEERNEWRKLVFEANRLGRNGRRVTCAEVLEPSTAADKYVVLLTSDSGPRTATESW